MAPGFELMGWFKQAEQHQSAPDPATLVPVSAGAPGHASAGHTPQSASRIAAPHSQAAAALAAALSAGGVPEKKQLQPHGTTVLPLEEVLEVNRSRADAALVVSKIANVKSEISRRHGHAIAVDANYICYGLKGGQIRILNRHTGARTLLKDHAAPVTDLRFFRHDSERCLLASVDTTGQVHVRKLYEEDTGVEETIRDEILARHELPISTSGPAAHPPARLAWHPAYDFVLAVAAGPNVYFVNVPPTADVAAAPEYANPVVAAHSADGDVYTSIAFSSSGEMLAVGDARGYVCVWGLSPDQLDPALIQPLAPEPDIRFHAYNDDSAAGSASPEGLSAVASLHWLREGGDGASGDSGAKGEGEGSTGRGGGGRQAVLLTGDGVNANLKLWTVDLSSKPECSHGLQLVAHQAPGSATGSISSSASISGLGLGAGTGARGFFNHLEFQPLYDCVVLANELRNLVYVLHVDLGSNPDAPSFDYCSEFSVAMPVLSCTLVPETFVDEMTDADAFHMYTVQSEAVQQYTIVPAQCFPMPASVQHHHHHADGAATGAAAAGHAGAAGTSSAADASPAVRDPLAMLLQQAREQQHATSSTVTIEPHTPAPAAPAPAPAAALGGALPLVSMPSDVSDATSTPQPQAAAAVAAPAADRAAGPDAGTAAAGAAPAAEGEAHVPVELLLPGTLSLGGGEELARAAAKALAEVEAAAAQQAQAAEPPPPPPPSTLLGRSSLLLTPSQLMQSAAAARSAAGSVGGAPTANDDLVSVVTTAGDETASVGGVSSVSQSLATPPVVTPTMSDANLAVTEEAAAAAAAAVAEVVGLETAEEIASATAAAVAALPAVVQQPPPASSCGPRWPGGLPPQPSAQMVRRVSLSKGGASPAVSVHEPAPAPHPAPLHTNGSGVLLGSMGSEPMPPLTEALPSPLDAAAAALDTAAAAKAAAPASVTSAAEAQAQQPQLAQLIAMQQQLLEQMSAGQREVLKVVRAEAQRSVKAAADAAAAKAAEAVARKAAEDRKREAADAHKALTAALTSVSKDLSQRVADAAAATTAAIKAAIGPAVRAAVAEALPAALSAGATAAALERALAGQIAAALPKAVTDGLGTAFATQVVPPLERATSSAFAQMDAALRSGLEAHLAPLGASGGQIKEAVAQVRSAAKALESEVSGVQQSAATTSRAATALTAVLTAAQQQAAAAPTPSPSTATAPLAPAPTAAEPPQQQQQQRERGGKKAAAAGGKGAQAAAADPSAVAAAAAAAAAAAVVPAKQPAPQKQQPKEPAPSAAAPAATAAAQPVLSSVSSVASAAPAPAAAVPPPPPPPPANADPELLKAVTDLISAGDVDTAMGRVLERTDLALVVWACGALGGPGLLAREPCPLSQPTLLSLLTFLDFDLTSDVDLKLVWIDAILKRLDVKEPGLAQHIKAVLVSVKAKLVDIARGSTGPTATRAKQAAHQAIALVSMTS